MQNYELAIIVSGQLPEDLAKQITGKVKKTIEDEGGKVSVEDFWGRRRLAYKIAGQDHGYYNIFIFSIGPEKLSKFEGELKMIGEVIRFLLVKKETEAKALAKSSAKKKVAKKEIKIVEGKEVIEEKPEQKEEKEKKSTEKSKVEEVKTEVTKEEAKKETKPKADDKERLEELDKKIDEILND